MMTSLVRQRVGGSRVAIDECWETYVGNQSVGEFLECFPQWMSIEEMIQEYVNHLPEIFGEDLDIEEDEVYKGLLNHIEQEVQPGQMLYRFRDANHERNLLCPIPSPKSPKKSPIFWRN